MPLKKSRLVNFRMDDELFDNVEKFAEEKNITSSEAYRILTKSGLRLEGIKPEEITTEKVEEMCKDMNEKMKHEIFLQYIDSMTEKQQKGLKSWLEANEERQIEREKQLRP